ncbi:MAG TPA: potassium-transporting ATPase subunit KdpA, partial [Planctomycetaceae bacterium]|nr:potassium-transporting ATPase subunit KdpA [Planctomycetaceae bacterium]
MIALTPLLGSYMARVYEGGQPVLLERVLGPFERLLYRVLRVDPGEGQDWKRYARSLLVFSAVCWIALYVILRTQTLHPWNHQDFHSGTWDVTFNTASSFVTNTNWQYYGGEYTMSYLTQMAGLAVQNFVSAATGIAVLIAVIRGFARRNAETIGNFWVDLTRSTVYVLLPLSVLYAVLLVSQGVPQNFKEYQNVALVQPTSFDEAVMGADGKPSVDAEGKPVTQKKEVTEQLLPMGPVASQIAIKQLGTNGGGYFNVNSAHPYENPTPLSNFLEMLAILLISGALCWTFGDMVGDRRQGWAVLAAMLVIFVPLMIGAVAAEQSGVPAQTSMGVDQVASDTQSGGNMEGKELRFGIVNSGIWASATTAASNGSVNSMHDSFTPLGGLVPMWLIQLGEVIFG